jgi:hypothetical protein
VLDKYFPSALSKDMIETLSLISCQIKKTITHQGGKDET